jgi:imidazolonepropionase-like amidohydrolase
LVGGVDADSLVSHALVSTRLTSTQFALDELTAIVEEAEAAGTYVSAHAYKPCAIKRALQCGVRSIEHGNWLDRECAEMMRKQGAILVPTTV